MEELVYYFCLGIMIIIALKKIIIKFKSFLHLWETADLNDNYNFN